MAGFVETFEVIQKGYYNSGETELANDAELRAENGTDADDLQIFMQRTVCRAVLRADMCVERCADVLAENCAEPFADIRAVVGAEPRAVICAVVRADDGAEKWQHCRNELQKPCRTCR